ncbi:PD-(D/E)XK motif protein [Micromonospora tarensis]|uniref:PD-(D/E)XK motif protein n=1 Tax=Micromonospora tarensis TaxID=2806100 RepID=A0ABS1YAY2_9ACTN|nr:PD-(D/E)XK motif protein [Micromonospora tarensis]MBM0274512.1 PD-(D/E)XK motif protein [Micromonospora tarensis]
MSGRHLTPASFEQYLRSGVNIEHPIDGKPWVTLLINPGGPMIGLRAPRGTHEVPPRVRLENVSAAAGHGTEGQYLEIRVTDPQLFSDAYPVLCAIADRIQVQGMGFTSAVSDTLNVLGQLLQPRRALPRERELGLCGELLTFIGLCRHVGAAKALAAWRGPTAAEHDFGIDGFDVEAKTTAAERRTHWVGSLTQLTGTGHRPLFLASHQLTEAGPDDGWRLGELVAVARREVAPTGLRQDLDRRLTSAGWIDPFTDMCRTRWRRRFPSTAYLVDQTFPRLTPNMLTDIGVNSARMTDVRYRIDLTGLPAASPTPILLAQAISAEVTI